MSISITQDTEDGTLLYHAEVLGDRTIKVRCAVEGCLWRRDYATAEGCENGTSQHFAQVHKRRIFIARGAR